MARRFHPGRVVGANRKWRQHLLRIHIAISAGDVGKQVYRGFDATFEFRIDPQERASSATR